MSAFFIRRPIVAIVIAVLTVLIGLVCMITLPVAQYPQIAPPEIVVQTHYTGADASTIEQSVAAPIEQKMSGVDKMNYMTSTNANNGDLRLTVNFDVATDPNIDQILTQLRVSQAQSQLPQDVNNFGVTVQKSAVRSVDACCSHFSEADAMTAFSWPTTLTSIWSTSYRGCPASPTCRYSAPGNTPCGCGSNPTSWPSSVSPCRTSSAPFRRKTR